MLWIAPLPVFSICWLLSSLKHRMLSKPGVNKVIYNIQPFGQIMEWTSLCCFLLAEKICSIVDKYLLIKQKNLPTSETNLYFLQRSKSVYSKLIHCTWIQCNNNKKLFLTYGTLIDIFIKNMIGLTIIEVDVSVISHQGKKIFPLNATKAMCKLHKEKNTDITSQMFPPSITEHTTQICKGLGSLAVSQ